MWGGEGDCESDRRTTAFPTEGRARRRGRLPQLEAVPRAGRRRPSPQLEAVPRAGGARPPFQLEAVPRAGRRELPLQLEAAPRAGGRGRLPQLEAVPRAGRREPPLQLEASPRAGRRMPPLQLEATPRAGGRGRLPQLEAMSRARKTRPPPSQPAAAPRAGGARFPLSLAAAEDFASSDLASGFFRGENSNFIPPTEKVWDDLPPYLEGYSSDHIAAIMSLPKCPSFDSGENLEDLSDFELESTDFRRSDQCDDIASDGAPGSERCETDDDVVSEDEETESEGEEVESDSEAEITQVSARRSVVMALGVDGRRSGAAGRRVPRCRTVDIGACDSVLTREQLAGLRVTYRVPSAHKFILPSRGRRIRDPPAGCFTVYTAYFDNGFSIPPHPLLVKVIRSYGVWLATSSIRVGASDNTRKFSCCMDRPLSGGSKACRFLAGFVSSKGPWKEKFFYVRDDGRGLASEWSSSPIKITHRKEFGKLRQGFMAAGLFSCLVDIAHYSPSGKKLEIDAVRARKAAVREQKRRDQESAPPQVGSSVSAAPHGASTGSVHSGSLPTPTVGPSPPPKRQRGAVSAAEGDARDAGMSKAGGSSSYWSRTQGVVRDEDLSQVADLSEEQMDELLAENMARALVVSTAAAHRRATRLAEIRRLEAVLEQREGDFSKLKEERDEALGHVASWERRFEREVSSGKKFLASASGVAFVSKTQEEAVSKFQESEEFETILTDRAAPIYDDAIRRCRRVLRQTLREKGRIVEDDIRLLDPDVSEGEDEVVEVADG
ncbi:UNVERIFIED_CONTAM: hypothetical protein Sindi_0941200 [Sesamum indicum]